MSDITSITTLRGAVDEDDMFMVDAAFFFVKDDGRLLIKALDVRNAFRRFISIVFLPTLLWMCTYDDVVRGCTNDNVPRTARTQNSFVFCCFVLKEVSRSLPPIGYVSII